MKAVVDANVLVSAFFWEGPERAVLKAAKRRRCELVLCRAVLEETAGALTEKFGVPRADVESHVLRLLKYAEFADPPTSDRRIARDPADDRVLEAAVAWRADAVVTGDRDLLDLGTFEGIVILRAPAFLRLLEDAKP